VPVQKLAEQESCRTGADNGDLGSHQTGPSSVVLRHSGQPEFTYRSPSPRPS
jgi:hypothetical protein